MRTNARRFRLLLLVSIAACSAATATAATLRHSENYVLPGTDVLHDDLYAAGKIVDVQGTVDGDLVVGGQTVLISGTVTGDVLVAAREVTISGRVGGTVRATGNNITINGPVGHDVLAACGTMVIGPQAHVGRDVLAGAGSSSFAGRIDRDVRVASGAATFSGAVGGDVHARVKELALNDGAVLEKDVFYTSKNELTKAPGAVVRGRVERRQPPAEHQRRHAGGPAVGWVRGLIGFLLFGGVLYFLFGGAAARAGRVLTASPLPSLGVGAAVAFVGPCVAGALFILGILIGGWWIGLGAFLLWFFVLAAGYVVGALATGAFILSRAGRKEPAYGWALLLGLVVLGILTLLPFVGWWFGGMAAFLGVGALAILAFRARRATRAA